MLSILVALLIIAALIWLIIPQIYTSVESIVLNSQDYYDTLTGWINKFFENNPEVEEVLLSATGNVSDGLLDWAKTALLPSMGKVVTSVTTGIYAVLRAILNVAHRLCRRLLCAVEYGAASCQVEESTLQHFLRQGLQAHPQCHSFHGHGVHGLYQRQGH